MAKGVNVGSSISLAVEAFGSHVAEGANDIAGVSKIGVGIRIRKIKVGDPGIAV